MKRRENVIILIILLVVGFASVSTTLIFNGSLGIAFNSDDWDVRFIDVSIDKGIASIENDGKAIIFETNTLVNVGESFTLNYKVKNNSTQYKSDIVVKCSNIVSDYIDVNSVLSGIVLSDDDKKITIDEQEVLDGRITGTLIKASTENDQSINVTCEIVASPIEHDVVSDYEEISNKQVFDASLIKIMNITAPSKNLGTQQSIAVSEDKIYVLYPSDGGYPGVIQEYDTNGNITATFSDMNLSHASNAAYYNGYLYVLGTKRKSKNLEIYKINVADGTQQTIYLEMSKSMIWDGLSIYNDKIYCIGVDQNGNVDGKARPNDITLEVVDIVSLKSESSTSVIIPEKNWYTCQGLAVYEDYAYALISPANSSGEFINGLNLYKIDIRKGDVEIIEMDASTFKEPEGAAIYEYKNNIYVISSLVNKGGVYTIAKIVESSKSFEEETILPNLVNNDISFSIGKTLASTEVDTGEIGSVINWTNDRMVTESIYTLKAKDTITLLSSDYLYNIYFYDANFNYDYKTSWISDGEFTFESDINYRIIVKPKDLSEFSESDIENVKKNIIFDLNFTIGKTLASTEVDTGEIGSVIDWTNDRMVTETIHLSNSDINISSKEGFLVNVYFYSEDGSYISKTGFVEECVIPSNTLYRIIIKPVDSNYMFTEQDVNNYININ